MMKDKILKMISLAIDKDGNSHMVTLVGRYRKVKEYQSKETKIPQQNGLTKTVIEPIKKIKREFAMAYAICHPEDEFDANIGELVALRRIGDGKTIGTLVSYDVTMLNDKQCELLMTYEMARITENINNYIK